MKKKAGTSQPERQLPPPRLTEAGVIAEALDNHMSDYRKSLIHNLRTMAVLANDLLATLAVPDAVFSKSDLNDILARMDVVCTVADNHEALLVFRSKLQAFVRA